MSGAWQFTPHALPSLGGALACLAMAPYAWRRRPAPGTSSFLVLLLSLVVWSLGQTLALSLTELPAKVWTLKFLYLGVATAPVAWLVFVLSYTGLIGYLSRTGLALLAVVPLATVSLAFSNDQHGLLWSRIELVRDGPFLALAIEHGLWFSVSTAYAFLLVLLSVALTAWTLSQSPHQRSQLLALLVAPLIVCSASLIDLAGWSPVPLLDPTPFSFALAGLVLGWSLFRHRLFDLVPVTRNVVLERMTEPVVVLDERGRVLDFNSSAQRALGLTPAQSIGSASPRALETGRPAPAAPGRNPQPWEVTLDAGRRRYEVSVSPLPRGRSGAAGQVLVLHETTLRRQAEEALLRAKEELQLANEQLAHLANTDALTGLSSRRQFLRRLAEEAARARRHRQPLSVLMLDLDYFKSINDTYGHVVGDQVLVAAAGAIAAIKRESDIAGRIGGEEFGLILPATDLDGGRAMAERLRRSIGEQRHLTDAGLEFSVTASLGVATFASGVRDETELLSLADAALYYAKELGRDRVCVAGGPAETIG